MKHLVLLFYFAPLHSFSQFWQDHENWERPFYLQYAPDSILKNKVSSITKRRIRMLGDSITNNEVLEQIFYGKDGKATQQIYWNEWTATKDSTIINLNDDQIQKSIINEHQCVRDLRPSFLKITQLTGLTCFPKEITRIIDQQTQKKVENDKMIEFVGFNSPFDSLRNQSGYFHPNLNTSNDSLDMRNAIRINTGEQTIEFQTVYIVDPPTNVPHTMYHRNVYHFDFSLRLLWKDIYQANLGYYNFEGDKSEYKVSQIVYDYDENGMLKREITFLEENPYSLKDYGLYIQQIQYEITYRE